MADNLSDIGDAIRQAGEAYADTITKLTNAMLGNTAQSTTPDRGPIVENWLRLARMSKDGMVKALEQGFETWEREIRRTTIQSGATAAPTNPIDVWSENWRKAVESFAGGADTKEFRKQAEATRSRFAEGMHAWQRLWGQEKHN